MIPGHNGQWTCYDQAREEQLSPPLVKPLVYANVLMMDTYLPGIMSVIYGNVAPEEVVARVEGTARRAED